MGVALVSALAHAHQYPITGAALNHQAGGVGEHLADWRLHALVGERSCDA